MAIKTLKSSSTYYCTNLGDFVTGSNGKDRIYGGIGDDVITGGFGNDYISGGAGVDLLTGGNSKYPKSKKNGNNYIDGGSGNDIILSFNGRDTIYGGSGSDFIDSGGGNDLIYGGDGADTVSGDSSNDKLYCGNGNDVATGGSGNDYIDLGKNDDIVVGESGNDTIVAYSGINIIDGGKGNDVYKVKCSGSKTTSFITDKSGNDKIQIFGVTGMTNIKSLHNLKFSVSKDKKSIMISYISNKADNMIFIDTGDNFKGDKLQLYGTNNKKLLGGDIDLNSVIRNLRSNDTLVSLNFKCKNGIITVK